MSVVPVRILPTIVISQFAATSLWFAANAVMPDLERSAGLPTSAVGKITIAVQLGFIAGTLVFAWLSISDRFSPRIIFFLSTLAGATANAATLLSGGEVLLAARFATGFFLAGIYPVGMKIAAGWYDRDLGLALGWLVGALVLGTALPHLVRGLGGDLPWQAVILSVSAIAIAGGLAMLLLVPDGPHLRAGARFDPTAFATIFRSAQFRASAFGYFGHMWELYAFYAFLPVLLAARLGSDGAATSLWSFAAIAAGFLGCVVGGYLSRVIGSLRVASIQLTASGSCCLLSPLMFMAPLPAFLSFLLFWGVVIAGDSPQFSALNARFAPSKLVGSALTIANCIGFSITAISIALLALLIEIVGAQYVFVLLVAGPVLGLVALRQVAAN
ncbi:MFS transporter [Chelativorans sp. ZYF759]|uniref:MFS transporter n=1 Tax=Chelativorans sp. ZYF759 TaxID=2692213 RepID=UPI00145F2935|nr:MFS transporter [Chelativorans sp. ZYF759]NMG39732.1 MFS transporter [Chelativorans sp. ZYF759]